MSDQRYSILLETMRAVPGGEREAWLKAACGTDDDLRKRVESTFRQLESAGLAEPAAHDVEKQDADLTSVHPATTQADQTSQHAVPTAGPQPPVQASGGEQVDQWIGRYQLKARLGEGGFGTVWLAEQYRPVRRQVALKLIKLGMDTQDVVTRFESERQMLAQMDHPGIAAVFDGGATEQGRPFFVMERVIGVSIMAFCEREALDVRSRLRLLIGVCRAIQHAHQKGVIHRDIKPSNILVARLDGHPQVKVIDFGIAKATASFDWARTVGLTGVQQVVGTPAYMSPEQAAGSSDIDTRSDIYALGVLTYELITGSAPMDLNRASAIGLHEVLRMIREDEPERPSQRVARLSQTPGAPTAGLADDPVRLRAQLRGDLDWIVMKCLEKQPDRRYASAEALATDLERHLADEPVLARAPEFGYLLGKFMRRHRPQMIAAALLLTTLVLGLIGTAAGLHRALRATERAELAQAEAASRTRDLEKVTNFQAQQLQSVQPTRMGEALRERILDLHQSDDAAGLAAALAPLNFTEVALSALDQEVFARAQEALAQDFAEQANTRIQLLRTLAITAMSLGLLDRADLVLAQLVADCKAQLGAAHPETLMAQILQALVQVERGQLQEAEPVLRENAAKLRIALGPDHPQTLFADNAEGWLLRRQWRLDEAEPLLRRTAERRQVVLGERHPDSLTSIDNMAVVLSDLGQLDEAESWARRSFALAESTLGNNHLTTLFARHNLAHVFIEQRQLPEAVALLEEGLDLAKRALGESHLHSLRIQYSLARALAIQGRFEAALPHVVNAEQGRRRILPPDDDHVLQSIALHARILRFLGRDAEAVPMLLDLDQRLRERFPTANLGVFWRGVDLLQSLRKTGQSSAALAQGTQLLQYASSFVDPEWPHALLLAQHAVTLANAGRANEAHALAARALAMLNAQLPPPDVSGLPALLSSTSTELQAALSPNADAAARDLLAGWHALAARMASETQPLQPGSTRPK